MKKKINKKFQLLISTLLLSVFLLTGCEDLVEEVLNEVVSFESVETEEDADYQEDVTVQEDTVQEDTEQEDTAQQEAQVLDESGTYTSKEEVAAYLNEYGHLPDNFITKKEAKKLRWVKEEGNFSEVAPGKSIGGDYFGNYEGVLPEEDGREYHECDIDYDGKRRGAKRIVYSNDGLIYYTEDHYETFTLLYGEE